MSRLGPRRYESVAERLIREAQERGEFDNLPGAGKPLQGLDGRHDPEWWVKQKIANEDLSGILPGALSLRREVENLSDTVAQERSERNVREIVEDLNARILDGRRRQVDGPRAFVPTVDVEDVLDRWRARREEA